MTPVQSAGKIYPTLFGCEQGSGGKIVVIGLPYDHGTPSDQPGCASAPQLMRRISAPEFFCIKHGAIYDLARKKVMFQGHSLSDLGDIRCRPSQSDDDYCEFVTHAVSLLAREHKIPFALGGDHLITLLILRGIARTGRRIQVVQLDAHHDYDLIESGERPTHATFVSFIAMEELAEKVIQIGVRGLSWGEPSAPNCVVCVEPADLQSELLPGVDVYLTIDTDAFDPSVASAVHFPVPEGLTFSVLEEVLDTLRKSGLRAAGADWTEYSPLLDSPNHITGRFILHGLSHILKYLSSEYS